MQSENAYFYDVIDLLASEYGWTIEYIQSLEISEINELIKRILRRNSIPEESSNETLSEEEKMEKLIRLGIAKKNG